MVLPESKLQRSRCGKEADLISLLPLNQPKPPNASPSCWLRRKRKTRGWQ